MTLSLIAVSEFICHGPNTTTCHHQLGDDSRLCMALAAQNKHTVRKYNISARVPRGNGRIWAHFSFFHPYKKCAKIPSLPPGYLADKLYLHTVCLFCAASAMQRRESSPSWWWQVVVFGLWQTNSKTAIKALLHHVISIVRGQTKRQERRIQCLICTKPLTHDTYDDSLLSRGSQQVLRVRGILRSKESLT